MLLSIAVVAGAVDRLRPADLLAEGRVYGGGLHKLEPKELANVPVPAIAALLPTKHKEFAATQAELFEEALT